MSKLFVYIVVTVQMTYLHCGIIIWRGERERVVCAIEPRSR